VTRQHSGNILITAALPYANGPVHLGHLAGAYLPADIYARYQRLRGRRVLFVCGSDEHGVPITITAGAEGITPQQVVDRYHEQNKRAFERFGMSFDTYSRTSLPLHHDTARSFLADFHKRGILKEKSERQFYDESAHMFLPDRYVEGRCPVCGNEEARGDQCEQCGSYLNPADLLEPRSKISGKRPVLKETRHLYFPLGAYQERLEAYVAERDQRDGWKENVLKYCRSWFREGLQDRAVTRDLQWGVKVPVVGYEEKVLYVWFDAVLGYISASKEWSLQRKNPEEWRQFWLEPSTKYVSFIGKDNVVFHCIVFPAMLMAWNDGHSEQFVLPENVPANEFLNFEGQKFSKSRGWGIDVNDFLDRYPSDPLRYYLATALPESRDSDFFWKEFQAKTNNEFLAILGNFVHRTLAFTQANFGGVVPEEGVPDPQDRGILSLLRETPDHVAHCYEEYRFRDGLFETMNLARASNKYFNDAEPWKTLKSDPAKCSRTIHVSLQIVRALAILISPVLPDSSEGILSMLNLRLPAGGDLWRQEGEPSLPGGHTLSAPRHIVQKIEDAVIEQERQTLTGDTAVPKPEGKAGGTISIDEFRNVHLRIGRVLSCERVEKTDKLLKLRVVVGSEERQLVAGLAEHYTPEALAGKLVLIVANLQPATIRGIESHGMLLAASGSDGRLVIVSPESEVEPGSVVR